MTHSKDHDIDKHLICNFVGKRERCYSSTNWNIFYSHWGKGHGWKLKIQKRKSSSIFEFSIQSPFLIVRKLCLLYMIHKRNGCYECSVCVCVSKDTNGMVYPVGMQYSSFYYYTINMSITRHWWVWRIKWRMWFSRDMH